MKVTVPRAVVVALGGVFSAYIVVLALTSFPSIRPEGRAQYTVAIVLFVAATAISLVGTNRRMPLWMAVSNFVTVVVVPLLVAPTIVDGHTLGSDYATWYAGGTGVLMVITLTRGHSILAWLGIISLALQTTLWAGPGAILSIGVFGSALWVLVAQVLIWSLGKAATDAQAYALAEREAAEWQAAQEAHLFERRFRLDLTSRTASPMLRQIVASGAELTAGQRKECVYLEASIRDEIRGRSLLDDAVREQVMTARRRGASVLMLDEGGLDDVDEVELARIRSSIAEALLTSSADSIIIRTVPEGSEIAVTVVGLASSGVNLLGHSGSDDGEESEIELWLEIPRAAEPDPVESTD